MSKAAKATEPTFEDALGKLESIVEDMETGELPLEQLLARFEDGTRLAKLCQDKLAAAELKVRQLETNSRGEEVLREYDTGDGPTEAAAP
ncbi:MAG: exodeoxyribonuclease VII small subunit [Verrucomicrobiales bacterium]|nr:exodeoxyribonuclease VII small subunit [Verrucomicrobiales bacterium]